VLASISCVAGSRCITFGYENPSSGGAESMFFSQSPTPQ
jgi:hypothetical protein